MTAILYDAVRGKTRSNANILTESRYYIQIQIRLVGTVPDRRDEPSDVKFSYLGVALLLVYVFARAPSLPTITMLPGPSASQSHPQTTNQPTRNDTRSQGDPPQRRSAEQRGGGSAAQTSFSILEESIGELIGSLSAWSQGRLTKGGVDDAYLQMGNNLNRLMRTYRAAGIDMREVASAPTDFRLALENLLEGEATPERLNKDLPKVRTIFEELLATLRRKQVEFKAQATTSISSKLPSETPLGDTVQIKRSLRIKAKSRSCYRTHMRRNTFVDSKALVLTSSENLSTIEERQLNVHLPMESEVRLAPMYVLYRPSIPYKGPLHAVVCEALPLIDSSPAPEDLDAVNQSTITREMSVTEIIEHLGHHGCKDITTQLNESNLSEYPISTGGCGDVYCGTLKNGSKVAIKCLRLQMDSNELSKKQLRRTAQELYVWSKCVHPNVVGLVGMAQYRNQIAMVSPWMQYGNLRRLLAQEPRVDCFKLCAQIVDGIVYLHEAGVVHGDLKGDNILFGDDLTPRLIDFGNATLKEYTLRFSQTTSKAGMSLNWVAPEVLKEETGITREADIWSLGMTMLEVITGDPPYHGLREVNIMRKIEKNEHPTRPEEVMPSRIKHADLLWSLFELCWAYNPIHRPSAVEVRDKMKVVILERDKEDHRGRAPLTQLLKPWIDYMQQ